MANETCPKCGSAMAYEHKPPGLNTFVCRTQTVHDTGRLCGESRTCLHNQLAQAHKLLRELLENLPRNYKDGRQFCYFCGVPVAWLDEGFRCEAKHHPDCLGARAKQLLESK